MSVETSIFEALCARLAAGTFTGTPSIAWPNVAFDPPAAGYLAASLFPSEAQQVTLGGSGYNRHTGLFQVSVFLPKGEGEVDVRTVASEVVAQFKRGTDLTSGSFTLRIVRPPTVGPALYEGNSPYVQIPVTIRYVCDALNP